MNETFAARLVRPLVRNLRPYVPGEQPKIKGLIKLNTNENPYSPSAKVIEAVRSAVDARLRLYPNPTADILRESLAKLHGCMIENIIVGNGSDELLALATRAFVEPLAALGGGIGKRGLAPPAKATVQYLTPSYSLYPVLAEIHGAAQNAVPLAADFSLPTVAQLQRAREWNFEAALTYITTPNAPTGRGYSTGQLAELCQAHRGVIVLDEAYVDFAAENAMALAIKYPNVIVSRTFSKAYALCFQRVGYFVGSALLIGALHKIRDSYNVNGLAQVGAMAALDDRAHYRDQFRRIIQTRDDAARSLAELGFNVLPSQTNFLLARPPTLAAKVWLEKLRERKILVRWFDQPDVRDYLRISVGTESEMDALVSAAGGILRQQRK